MLGTKREWANFIRELGIKTEFLHRDEFKQAYPKVKQDNLPAVFSSTVDSEPEVLITKSEINACKDLSALISLVRDRVKSSQQVAAHANSSK
jgi:hypothetical protein